MNIKESPQEFSSQNTTNNQLNVIYKTIDFKPNSIILDYGCGRYDKNIEFIKSLNKNLILLRYDKYNISKEENQISIAKCFDQAPDYILCSNVLNVIKEDEVMLEVIENINSLASSETEIIFKIGEGDQSGIGKETTRGYQRNQYTNYYIPFLQQYFKTKRK